MSFLNPAILFGLLAVSIPILIHLLNLRKIKKVEFSTLMFLREIQKSKMRRIKLKQLILLFLRIMAIVCLVLCFAQPVYEGYAGGSNSSASTVVIFVDDSFSMTARDNKGQYISQAKDAVKKILDAHRETDDIYLIPGSWIGLKKNKIVYDNFSEVLDSAGRIQPSYKPFIVNEALAFAEVIISNSKNAGNEVYLISDFQKNNFGNEILTAGQFPVFKDRNVRTYLVQTGGREVRNLSLDSFSVVTKLFEKDKDIKVKLYLRNHSQFNVTNKSVSLYIDNQLKGEKAVDAGSFDSKEIEFVFKPDRPGNLSGMIELVQDRFEEDEIVQDNKYYFSVYIPDKFSIAMIAESSADARYLDLAVNTAASLISDSIRQRSELFNINNISTIDQSIFSNDLAFISNKSSFTENEATLLTDFTSNGGGVFLFLGSSTDINNYNKTIFSKLGTVRIDKLNSQSDLNKNLKFDKVDFENPVLSEIFSNQNLNITSERFNIDSPEILSYYELLPGDQSKLIISLSNNKPFLLESGISNGKILISSVPPTMDFSDLPLKSIFVPLIIRSIYYLSNNFAYQKEFVVGGSSFIGTKGLKGIAELRLPDNNVIQSGDGFSSGSGLSKENYLFLPYSDITSQKGNYTLRDSSGSEYLFSMNSNPGESNTAAFEKEELENYFASLEPGSLVILDAGQDITEAVKEKKDGLALWKYFLIGAILFVLAEILLSKRIEEGK